MATNILPSLKQCRTEFDPMRGPAGQEEPQSDLVKAWQDWKQNFKPVWQQKKQWKNHQKQRCCGYLEVKSFDERRPKYYRTNEGETYEYTVRKLNEYFQEKRNINSLRSKLFSMQPKEGEQTSEETLDGEMKDARRPV